MDVKDIKALINEVSSSDIYELRYEENGTKIQLSKGAIESDKNKGTVAATVEQQGQQPDNLEKTNEEPDNNGGEKEKDVTGNVVIAPLVGTVYLGPSENEAPFVSVGDKVKKGQTLAIIEAMKLMNEIESKYDGVVKKVLVENEMPVEFGQEMFVIE